MLKDQNSFYRDLGERIKTIRIQRKISQEKLADHLGLTRSSVVNFEGARHKPSLFQVIQIANFLAVDYVSLIPYKYDKGMQLSDIDLEGVVSDEGVLDSSTKNAVLGFISDIEKG